MASVVYQMRSCDFSNLNLFVDTECFQEYTSLIKLICDALCLILLRLGNSFRFFKYFAHLFHALSHNSMHMAETAMTTCVCVSSSYSVQHWNELINSTSIGHRQLFALSAWYSRIYERLHHQQCLFNTFFFFYFYSFTFLPHLFVLYALISCSF